MTACSLSKGLKTLTALLLLTVGLLAAVPLWPAEGPTVDLNTADSMRLDLDLQAGKKVRIKLISGQDLEGTVKKVGTMAVHLGEVSGMGLFDAVVRIDHISALIFKRKA